MLQSPFCGDSWPDLIISVAVLRVWEIAHCIYVPHFFKISSVDGPLLMSVSWHLEVPLQVNVGVHESFSVMVFRNRGPRVDIKFLGLALLKFSPSRGCCQCPFPGHLLGVLSFPCCLHHLLFADSQDGCSVRWDLISCCHRFLFCVFFFFENKTLFNLAFTQLLGKFWNFPDLPF